MTTPPLPTRPCVTCGALVVGERGYLPRHQCDACRQRCPLPPRCAACDGPLPSLSGQRWYCPACAHARRRARKNLSARQRRVKKTLTAAQQAALSAHIERQFEAALAALRRARRFAVTPEVAWGRPGTASLEPDV